MPSFGAEAASPEPKESEEPEEEAWGGQSNSSTAWARRNWCLYGTGILPLRLGTTGAEGGPPRSDPANSFSGFFSKVASASEGERQGREEEAISGGGLVIGRELWPATPVQ